MSRCDYYIVLFQYVLLSLLHSSLLRMFRWCSSGHFMFLRFLLILLLCISSSFSSIVSGSNYFIIASSALFGIVDYISLPLSTSFPFDGPLGSFLRIRATPTVSLRATNDVTARFLTTGGDKHKSVYMRWKVLGNIHSDILRLEESYTVYVPCRSFYGTAWLMAAPIARLVWQVDSIIPVVCNSLYWQCAVFWARYIRFSAMYRAPRQCGNLTPLVGADISIEYKRSVPYWQRTASRPLKMCP